MYACSIRTSANLIIVIHNVILLILYVYLYIIYQRLIILCVNLTCKFNDFLLVCKKIVFAKCKFYKH